VTPPPLLLDTADAATYAGVKPATLRVWRHRYGLTAHRRAGVTYYDLHELAAVLAARVTPATNETTPTVNA
jgi:DNA-binding transcriptional MerR regulator